MHQIIQYPRIPLFVWGCENSTINLQEVPDNTEESVEVSNDIIDNDNIEHNNDGGEIISTSPNKAEELSFRHYVGHLKIQHLKQNLWVAQKF